MIKKKRKREKKISYNIPNKKADHKKIFFIVGFLVIFYVFNKIGQAFSMINTDDLVLKLKTFPKAFKIAFKNPLPKLSGQPLLWGFIAVFVAFMMYQTYLSNKKKMRDGIEHGSASWGTPEELAPLVDGDFSNNIILSENEFVRMSSMPMEHIQRSVNKNVMVVGGSGSGKTRFMVKPNLMQMHSSYVITDPKGDILPAVGGMLEDGGYEIKVLNLINFDKSMHYNPLYYVKTQNDIDKLVHTLVLNTGGGDISKQGNDFFSQSAEILLTALVAYTVTHANLSDKNFGFVMDLLNDIKLNGDEEFKDKTTVKFDGVEAKNPRDYGVRMYKKFKANGEDKTAQSILGTAHAMMRAFENDNVRNLLSKDDLKIDEVGDRKTAFFIILPDTDKTFNFIVSILYTQMFNLLCTRADEEYGGRLPTHVRFLLDEFANIGKIPDFEILISTIRSREISATIILQTLSQLKAIYDKHAETITGNCDSFLFLGGKEASTLKEISEMLGKETIDTRNTSENKGRDKSFGQSFQRTGRELMTPSELATMDASLCIVQIKGCNPFKSKKFELTKHPNYKLTGDSNKKLSFNIENHIKELNKYNMENLHKIKAKADDKVAVVRV